MYLSSPDAPVEFRDEAGDTVRSDLGETAELAGDVSDSGMAGTEADGGNEVEFELVPGVRNGVIIEGDCDADFGVADFSGETIELDLGVADTFKVSEFD